MDHYTGNITPGKDIIPDNIWYCEEWYKAAHNRLSCEQGVPLDAGASCGMVRRTRGRKEKRRAAAGTDPATALSSPPPVFSLGSSGGAHHSVWPDCGDEGRRHWRMSPR